MAALFAQAANEELVPVPTIEISRGLRGELQALLTGADGPVRVIPYDIVHDFIKARAKRLAQEMDIVAGYSPPSDLVIECVIADLRAILLRVAEAGRSPVIIHDLLGIIPAQPFKGVSFIGSPSTQPVEPADATIIPAEERLGGDDDVDVSIEAIRAHAEFLADSTPEDLRRMCPILAEPSSDPLRAYWRQNLDRLADDEFSGWLMERSKRILDEAFGRP
ncbi:MAG: hypothetical protein AAF526_04400 [Pseudomonadota bacterium]